MTRPAAAARGEAGRAAPAATRARAAGPRRWLAAATAAVAAARPRQWPKNLLVFAAPLAGASLGRGDGFCYAMVACAAFVAASSAAYFVNDVLDAERDRSHPYKRHRPVASGQLPPAHAIGLAAVLAAAALAAARGIGEPRLILVLGIYLASSLLYCVALKHVPVLELAFVASGFVLRALGGAIATHVPPSGWFLLVCSLGALMVATAKRFSELTVLGADGASHRPVMRWYSLTALRLSQRAMAVAMTFAYLLWAGSGHDAWMRWWHLASAVPLALALARFDRLTARATSRPVEDLIARDGPMVGCELAWLALFGLGL